MKIINRLTLRSMRRNRRRTIVTGIGITLAVCLIASICTLASTLLQMTKDSTLIHTGSWQLRFDNIPFEKLGELSGAEGVDSVGVMRELGVIGDGSSDPQKAHFSVWSADEEAAALFQLTPQQGRLPQKEGELVAAPYSNYAIGDKVTLYPERRLSIYEDENGNEVTLFESEKADTEGLIGPIRYEYEKAGEGREYTVVGLASPSTVHLGQTLFAAVYFDKAALQPGDTVSVLATFKNLDKSVFSHGAALARSLEADPQYNTMLLGCYGLSEDMNYLLLFFAAGILAAALIAFSAGFFVYNAFSISLSERIRDLGLLSSVGATKRQKYHSVLFEASLYGLVCARHPAGRRACRAGGAPVWGNTDNGDGHRRRAGACYCLVDFSGLIRHCRRRHAVLFGPAPSQKSLACFAGRGHPPQRGFYLPQTARKIF